jgi:DNA-binding MarR family transcriptional regulator
VITATDEVTQRLVDASDWSAAVAGASHDSRRLAGLHATDDGIWSERQLDVAARSRSTRSVASSLQHAGWHRLEFVQPGPKAHRPHIRLTDRNKHRGRGHAMVPAPKASGHPVVGYYNNGTVQVMVAGDDRAADANRDELVDGVLAASRALVAVAARSLATVADDVTLAQYRVLIELASRGPLRLADLAGALGVDRSTATRMCDRLVRKGLVSRRRISADRRGVRVALTSAGADVVADVSRRRRAEIATIVARIPAAGQPAVVVALRAFADAAGEVPEQDWSLGWHLDP